ncbi:MAG: carboxypeptidase regulatory-like domain-containing protein [Bacteroidetes bacterium]|nr:carboxypeptidase regulatory-like domain-containing protein [Bacteroidota bacterium]
MKILCIIILLIPLKIFGQNVTVPGQVLDQKSNPVEAAEIDVVGENATTTTDNTGIFSLKLPASIKAGGLITLRISKNGYKTTTKHISASPLMVPIRLTKISGPIAKTKDTTRTNTQSASPQTNTVVQGSQHIVSGTGNNVGINGDVNINAEKRLGSDYLELIYNYVEDLVRNKNFDGNNIVVTREQNCNYPRIVKQIVSYLNSKGFKATEGYEMRSPPIEAIKIDTIEQHIQNTNQKKQINILVGEFDQ